MYFNDKEKWNKIERFLNQGKMNLFKLGKSKKDGKILSVYEVASGLDCNCICPNCEKDLVAAHGKKTDWYFRHHEQSDCNKGPETGILLLASTLFDKHHKIKLPQLGNITYQNPKISREISSYPLNISVDTEVGEITFDIIINPEENVEERKRFYKKTASKSFCIDFRNYDFKDREQFEEDLFENSTNKEVLYLNSNTSNASTTSSLSKKEKLKLTGIVAGLFTAGVSLGILAFRNKTAKK